VIVSDIPHLVIGNLGEPLIAKAERCAPKAGRRLQVLPPAIVEYVDAFAARENARTGLDVLAQVGLRMNQAGDIPDMQAV